MNVDSHMRSSAVGDVDGNRVGASKDIPRIEQLSSLLYVLELNHGKRLVRIPGAVGYRCGRTRTVPAHPHDDEVSCRVVRAERFGERGDVRGGEVVCALYVGYRRPCAVRKKKANCKDSKK